MFQKIKSLLNEHVALSEEATLHYKKAQKAREEHYRGFSYVEKAEYKEYSKKVDESNRKYYEAYCLLRAFVAEQLDLSEEEVKFLFESEIENY